MHPTHSHCALSRDMKVPITIKMLPMFDHLPLQEEAISTSSGMEMKAMRRLEMLPLKGNRKDSDPPTSHSSTSKVITTP